MDDLNMPAPQPGCPFCLRGDLELTLTETPSFYLLADHAPLVAGHPVDVLQPVDRIAADADAR